MGWVLERLGADLGRALTDVNVLAYALDRDGVIVWQNRASQEFIGDVRGSHFHDFIVVEDRRRAGIEDPFGNRIELIEAARG